MKNIGVIPGRYQPLHLGHRKLFKKAFAENKDGVYVVLIKGVKSGADKSRNPLDTKTQEQLIHRLVPEINVLEAPIANLPDIVYRILSPDRSLYLGDNQYHFTFYCGTDRYTPYKIQADRWSRYVPDVIDALQEEGVHIKSIDIYLELIEREDGEPLKNKKIKYDSPPDEAEINTYSSSAVRHAIISGDDKLAMRMMGLEEKDEYLYQKIARMITKGVMEQVVNEKIISILEDING